MAGSRVPGPLDGTKAEPIDRGTLNLQATPPPGPVRVLRHRFRRPGEWSSRELIEYDPDPRRGQRPHELMDWKNNWKGFRLPKFSPILVVPNPALQATPWEKDFGLTYDYVNRNKTPHPVLNARNEVVAHVAYFTNDTIFYPKKLRSLLPLSDVVDSGMPAFVRKKADRHFWQEAPPQKEYQLLVDPGGEVLAVLSTNDRDGVTSPSTLAFILDVWMIADGAFFLRRAFSAASLSRLEIELAERAAAAEQRRIERLAFANTQYPHGLDATKPMPVGGVPKPEGGVLRTGADSTGVFEKAKLKSDFQKRISASLQETGREIREARAAREARGIESIGKQDWLDEIAEIMDRVEKNYFPEGYPWD